ncbi:MAG TPA: maltose alpha-D-glucosyltransferase [Bryobacteraceae bacterium]|nr:maltose alpha-D-glucosyltransferase [Bryobacteraceae bacterium]
MANNLPLEDDPLWYKDAIIYELHVRAFHDSSGDGMGDFRGLTQKLDYLQDLGVTAIWLLPFSPSPWKDDGYDIADYNDVHPAYGTLKDFQLFLREAHRRGLRVITEVVINHTSDQHPWFQRARRAAPGSKWRDFYVWSDTPEKYSEARIIFKDFETSNWTWDPVAKAYYWHRFYSHQPDLNFDSPHVRQAVLDVIDFWFDMGVDAFRLDAIPYLFERPGTNCENLPETHAFLKEIRAHVDAKYRNRMLLAEANQWPDDSIAYFGEGNECNMAFHFPVMPRMFMANRMEDRYPIIEIMRQTPPIPENCQWAMFLRNHDELTLEMVTDEERDYMYRVYAQDRQMRINLGIRRRLAPLLGNDRRKIELMNSLLLSLPGTPVIYYGDEIGMGDNIYLGDRNGVRTPMQWSADRNAGFSNASPQRLYLPITSDPEYHYETLNVEAQQNNPSSLLWWMKRIIQHRQQFKAFGRGTLEFLHPENRKVLAFLRRYEDEKILVVANLSRFPQHVQLELPADTRGMAPTEVFGGADFPAISEAPYAITLGAHGFYWFALHPSKARTESVETPAPQRAIPVLSVRALNGIPEDDRAISAITRLVRELLPTRRWFRSKTRRIRTVTLEDLVPIPEAEAFLSFLRVEFVDGDPEDYMLPVAIASGDAAREVEEQFRDTVLARLEARDGSQGVLYGALWKPAFADALLNAIARRKRLRGRSGEVVGVHTKEFRGIWGGRHPNLQPRISQAEQSNSSIIYGDRFILKLFRKVESGMNPDIEISQFLTAVKFTQTPALAGYLEYRRDNGESVQLAILQGFVQNHGDAWNYTLDALGRFFERALASTEPHPALGPAEQHPLVLMTQEPPMRVNDLVGEYLDRARLLGLRTAQMHNALARDGGNPDFSHEPLSEHYRQGLYHGMLSLTDRTLQTLRLKIGSLPDSVADEAQWLLDREGELRDRFRLLRTMRTEAVRIRHHGDFHLGQVLYTGQDFVIIDFEGEPARPLSERRLKRSPLRDVAGMIRSFQYAAYAALFGQVPGVTARAEDLERLRAFAEHWTAWVSAAFLKGYLEEAAHAPYIPRSPEALRTLLDAYLLEKAVYEVAYELNNRPDWVRIPLAGIAKLLA